MLRIFLINLLFIIPLCSFAANNEIGKAYKNHTSDLQVSGNGIVVRLLADDLYGSKHQKFILKLSKNHTILIAHNIDLADRINNIKVGDNVKFYGEYEWSKKGGVVHWTHHDPQGRHKNGWLKHRGKTYQ